MSQPVNITMTHDTAEAMLWALREHLRQRTPVREYVDKRYAHMDESFRNRKIGEVQARIDRLRSLVDRLQTQVVISQHIKGEPQ